MSGFLIIPEDNFTLEAFTEIDVLVDGAIALDCYSDAYEDAVDEVTQKIKDIAGDRCEIRYAEVVREAQDAIAEAETEVSDGEQELADAKEELEDGWEQLADAKKEVAEGQMELADAKTQVSDGEKELNAAKDKVADGEKELADAKTQLADGQNQINQAKQQISDGEASIAALRVAETYYRRAMERAERMMERYLPFYQYYHSGATYRDDYYFLRAKGELSPESGSFVLDEEAEFSTGYDILAARLISVEMLLVYLSRRIERAARKRKLSMVLLL